MSPKIFRLHGVLASISGLTLVCLLVLSTLTVEAQGQQSRSLSDKGNVTEGAPVVTFNGMKTSSDKESSNVENQAEVQAKMQSLFEQGLQEFQKHAYSSALKSFNNVLALDGSHKGALKYQNIVQKKLTREPSGEVISDKRQDETPERAPEKEQVDPNEIKGLAAYQEGLKHYKNREYQQAIDVFSKALELIPNHSKSEKYLEKSRHYLAKQEKQAQQLAEHQAELERERLARATAEQLEAEVDDLMDKGRESLSVEDFDTAHDTFALVLEKDPENRKAKSYLEKTEVLAQKAQEKAQQEWLEAERAKRELALKRQEEEERKKQEAFQQEIETLLGDGEYLLSEDRYEEAKAVFNLILEKDPENRYAVSYIEKADDLIAQAEENAERERLEQQRREQLARQEALEEEIDALLDEGKRALKEDEYKSAKSIFAQVLEKDPENRHAISYTEKADNLIARAEERAERERLEQERREQLARQEALEKEIDGYLYAGRVCLKEEDFETARKYFRGVLAKDSDNSKALAYLEQVEEAKQARQDEIAQAEAEADREARQAAIADIIEQGNSCLKADEFDQAIEKYSEALAKAPEDGAIERLIADAKEKKASYIEEQERQQALAEAEERQQQQREKQAKADAFVDAGKKCIKDDEYDAAIAQLQQALEIVPDDSSAQSWLAKAREEKQDYEERQYALQLKEKERQEKLLAQQEEKAREAELDQQFNSARSLYRQGEYTKAKEGFISILQMDPENKEVRRYLERTKAEEENARVLLAAQQQQQSEVEAEEADRKEKIEQAYADGVNAFNEENYADALSCFQMVLSQEADHAGAARYLAKTQAAIEEEQVESTVKVVETMESAEEDTTGAKETILSVISDEDPPETVDVEVPEETVEVEVTSDTQEQVEITSESALVEVTPEARVEIAEIDESILSGESKDERLQQHLLLGKTYLDAKLLSEAKREIDAARQLAPEDPEVITLSEQIETALSVIREREQLALSEKQSEQRQRDKARAAELVQQGKLLYEQGEVISAVNRFQDALELDPHNAEAANFYSLTRDEYAKALERATRQEEQAERETEYEDKMNDVIPSLQLVDASIDEVLGLLGTVSGFNFVAGEGVEGVVTIHIRDKTVKDALELILKPYGFIYEREGLDIIIKPNFTTKIFQLTGEEYRKLEQILNDPENLQDPSASLQDMLYPGLGASNVPGRALYLNPKTLQLVVTDTKDNIAKVAEFLKNIPELTETAAPLITRLFPLNPEMANQLFKLIELMLYEGQKPQEAPSKEDTRQLLLEEDTSVLIVKDTEENIQKVIEILNDEAIQQRVLEEELVARRFIVSPETGYTDDALIRKQREVSSVEELLKNMLYSIGREEAIRKGRRMYPNYEEGTIDIVDTPENIKKVERFLASTKGDEQDMRIFPIRHADVDDLTLRLNLFAGRRVRGGEDDNIQDYDDRMDDQTRIPARIIPIPEAHSIVIRSNGPALDMFATMVEMLDVEPEQVEIETRLVEISLEELRAVGIDWSLTNVGEEGLHIGRHDGVEVSQLDINVLNAAANDGLNIAFDILGETELTTVLNLLSKTESVNVLSAPKVVTLTSTSANIDFTTTQPYVSEIEQDTRGTDTPADDTLRYIYDEAEIGITMDVSPVVSGDGSIIMDINPSVSSITGFVPAGAGLGLEGADRPIVDTRTTSTRVRIRDGESIVIGGLINDQVSEQEDRVPFVSSIPYIGRIFRQNSETVTQTSLLIFVTARLLQ